MKVESSSARGPELPTRRVRKIVNFEIRKRASSPRDSASVTAKIRRWKAPGAPAEATDRLAIEEPLEIRLDGESIAVTMRTPGHDAELAVGFLFTEGVLRRRAEVTLIAPCRSAANPEGVLNVFLAPGVRVDRSSLTRHVFASSSCGICGKASIESVHRHFPPLHFPVKVRARTLLALPDRMRAAQRAFAQTGGLHAAAIFTTRGRLVILREDVGRHNAVDKVVGFGFLKEDLPFDSHILLVSGRASFEIMQKALAARVPIVCAVSAPSSLAVQFARESGQTLVGFLRGESMNVYSGRQRVMFDGAPPRGPRKPRSRQVRIPGH